MAKTGKSVDKLTKINEESREFEEVLTERVVKGVLTESRLQKLTNDSDETKAYIGFYGLIIFYRTRMDYAKLERFFSSYEQRFSQHPTFWHLYNMCVLNTDLSYDPEQLLQSSYEKITHYIQENEMEVNISGYCHAFANLLVTSCERFENKKENLIEKWYGQAEEWINKAIEKEGDYAKFFCTRGRLHALKSKEDSYKDAERDVLRAIAIENSERTDYAVRIGQYQYYRTEIQAKRQIQQLKDQQCDTEKQLNKQIEVLKGSSLSNIEVLSFLAGIISFLLGSFSLAQGQTAKDAAALIVVLMGGLLTAFASFSLMLHKRETIVSIDILIIVIGAIIMAVGWYMIGG